VVGLILTSRIEFHGDNEPHGSERFLQADHASPSGYKVGGLPDYEIDPALAQTEGGAWLGCVSTRVEVTLGLLAVVLMGGAWLYWTLVTH
jgi:hypothetical protein